MDPLTIAIAAGGTLAGALPDLIPSRFERENKKRLKELQRKQEMGLLGLSEREKNAIQAQQRNTRRQAQQYAGAERGRLTQNQGQPQMALLGQQMADESRQRLEADLASQILNLDLAREAQQIEEMRALEAGQAQINQARREAAVAPIQAGAEAATGQIAFENMIGRGGRMPGSGGMISPQQLQMMQAIQQSQILQGLQSQFGLTPAQQRMLGYGLGF